MTAEQPFELLVTEGNYLLRAYAAPPPDIPPYKLDLERSSALVYYVNIGSFYSALCNGAPIAMIALISEKVTIFRRAGAARFDIIEKHERDKYRFCLGDVFICYSQCVTVMFDFFTQIAGYLDPETDVASLHHKQICDEDMHATMYWIQNLEWSTRLTAAKLAGQEEQQPACMQRYNTVSMPYAYLLYTQHLMYATIKKSHHNLGKRQIVPLLAFMLEGYIFYSSSLTEKFESYRSTSMQTMLMLKLNQDLLQRANRLGDQLLQEEEEEKQKNMRKLQRKQTKRQKRKAARQKLNPAVEEVSVMDKHVDPPINDVDSDDDSVIIIMDAEYPEWLKAMHRLYAKPEAYKHNITFIDRVE